MTALRKSLWMIAAGMALPAPAAAQEICAAMNRIAAAARETPPFGSVRRALAGGTIVVPGFRADLCRVSAAGVECGLHGMGARSDNTNWPDQISCPGFTRIEPHYPAPGPDGEVAYTRSRLRERRDYAGRGLRISFGISCAACAGPASSFFSAVADGR